MTTRAVGDVASAAKGAIRFVDWVTVSSPVRTYCAEMSGVPSTKQVHPFPARMAPELALDALSRVKPSATVLDPMCGSGTVLKHAIEEGHHAVGFDLDPLAVLLSKVSCRRTSAVATEAAAAQVVERARSYKRAPELPWMDDDQETRAFVDYWFAPSQRNELRRIAGALAEMRAGPRSDVLRLSLSRTIVTKDRGASRARDVSHSRPHRTRMLNDYDVYEGFRRAAIHIGTVCDRTVSGTAQVRIGDARSLPLKLRRSVDLVVTSPPYLNAIDYLRGHRLALVWLGHRLSDLRVIRSSAVGTERMPDKEEERVRELVKLYPRLSTRRQGMLDRYAQDVSAFMSQIEGVLKRRGEAILVVGDCNIEGVFIQNSAIVEKAAELAGLSLVDRKTRRLPPNSRYLPPPSRSSGHMSKRMRSEIVLRFQR